MAPAIPYDNSFPIAPAAYDTSTLTEFLVESGVWTRSALKAGPFKAVDIKSSRVGAIEPFTIIEGPSAWRGSDLRRHPEEWIYKFTKQDIAELDAAIAKAEAQGIDSDEKVPTISQHDFVLPTLGDKLRGFAKEVSGADGRGFQILRGIPVSKYSRLQLIILWWGIGQHIGRILPINRFGHLINHIHDLKSDIEGKKTRSPNTNLKQPFHSDQFAIDVIGMLSISKAVYGGDSRWASGHTIINELLYRGRKDLVETLAQRNFWLANTGYASEKRDRLAEEDGTKNYVQVQPLHYTEGRADFVFQSGGYISAQEHTVVPRLTAIQLEALRTVQAIAQDEDVHLRLILEPGDISLIHNTRLLHAREAFNDGEADNEKRHFLRWWNDTSGKDPELLRAAGPPPGFGERLIDAAGGWPQPPGTKQTIVLDTNDKSKAFFF